MKKLDPLLIEIFKRYEINAEEALWDCHGTWVCYHKYLEIAAGRAGIVFDNPIIIEADSKAGVVAIAVRGQIQRENEGIVTEWSFGESAPHNNKNKYPYAMAEKRAKDRVILKLLGIHGLVYSEEESDDFKSPDKKGTSSAAKKRVMAEFESDLVDVQSEAQLKKLFADYWKRMQKENWPMPHADSDEYETSFLKIIMDMKDRKKAELQNAE